MKIKVTHQITKCYTTIISRGEIVNIELLGDRG